MITEMLVVKGYPGPTTLVPIFQNTKLFTNVYSIVVLYKTKILVIKIF